MGSMGDSGRQEGPYYGEFHISHLRRTTNDRLTSTDISLTELLDLLSYHSSSTSSSSGFTSRSSFTLDLEIPSCRPLSRRLFKETSCFSTLRVRYLPGPKADDRNSIL